MSTAATWLAAIVIALALAAAPALMDGPDDMQAEWDQSQALKELQATEAGTARREAAAQKLCWQERGPNSEARWTVEGHLDCTVRTGTRRASL
ncbi:MAG: hypothetical protein ACK5A0_11040 [Polaromonas sp.]|jgi:Neuraminidase (sialidase)